MKILESTRIEAKKDFYTCGSVFLDIRDETGGRALSRLAVSESKKADGIRYKLKVNGKTRMVENYDRVRLNYGDRLVIVDIITGDIDPSEYVVNFKGFVGNNSGNDGEDRGYVIDTGAGVLMPKYSLERKGRKYHVVTTLGGEEVGKIYIDILKNS